MGVALIPRKSYDYDNQDRTGQDRTGQDRTGQDRTGHNMGFFSPVFKYEGCNTTILKPFPTILASLDHF
jgi:hypothetical protein